MTRETVDGRREFLVHVATSETDGVVEGYASYVDVTEQAAYEAALARQPGGGRGSRTCSLTTSATR